MIIDHGIEISFVMEVKQCLKQTIGYKMYEYRNTDLKNSSGKYKLSSYN